ncbi:MAG: hypothetical protein LBQ59_02160 [Candidatus Peribacteria bacterium]|nr:hypothetical protein [Candidatus Peribacteria bacterium]
MRAKNQLKCKSTFQTSPQPSPFEGEGEKQTCSPFPNREGENQNRE